MVLVVESPPNGSYEESDSAAGQRTAGGDRAPASQRLSGGREPQTAGEGGMPRVASRQGRLRTADVATDETVLFRDLMLSEPVLRGLLESGFERPSPIQLQAIPLGLVGTDLIAQAKSGTGKTCVFAVVVLESVQPERPVPQAVVLAPTREIAVQIGHVFSAIGSHCTGLALEVLIGGMAIQRDRERVRCCNVVVGTPGRVRALLAEGSLPGEAVRMLVLDEADKLMDDIFLPDLGYIVGALPQRKQILALSATYTAEQRDLLTGWMRDPTMVLLDADSVSLRGVAQRFMVVAPLGQATGQYALFEGKATALLQLLGRTAFHQCLVFLNGRARAHDLVETLNHHGYPAAFIGGDLPQQQRNAVMASMRSLRLRVLVSTDLTSRGVDVERVNLVINLDLPRCPETYIHRVGRTGRFGTHGLAIALVGSQELSVLLDMVRSLNSSIEPIESQLELTPADTAVSIHSDSVSGYGKDIDGQQQRSTHAVGFTHIGIHADTELGGSSVSFVGDVGVGVGTDADADASARCGGLLPAQVPSVEDDAAAAQLARLKHVREQAATKESDALELRRHQNAAGRSLVDGTRARRQRSKREEVNACGLRVSFVDGSAITEADATGLPDLFSKFGKIHSTQFLVGKKHGWVDFADASFGMAARVRDAVNGTVHPADTQLTVASGSSNGIRQLVVQPWANGSEICVTEGSIHDDQSGLSAASAQQTRSTIPTVQRPRALTTRSKNLGGNVLLSPGSIVWAKYTVDGLWYKAEVNELIRVKGGECRSLRDEDAEGETESDSDSDGLRVAVTYLGYNNFEVLPVSSIWQGAPELDSEPKLEAAAGTQTAYASSVGENMCEPPLHSVHQAVAQDGTTGLDSVCYGHPWYIDHLMLAVAQHTAQACRRASTVPIAPFPFDHGSAPYQRHRHRWPAPPVSQWRTTGM